MVGPMWNYFVRNGSKQNTSHDNAWCKSCVAIAHEQERPAEEPIDVEEPISTASADAWKRLMDDEWIKRALEKVKPVRGEKKVMATHVLNCKYALKVKAAVRDAKIVKGMKVEDEDQESDDEGAQRPAKKLRKGVDSVARQLVQQPLKVFRGVDVPFTNDQTQALQRQFLRATLSANLPFQWVEDPEVVKLLLMLRSSVGPHIPDRRTISGRLLNEAASQVDKAQTEALTGKYTTLGSDGWKDCSRMNINGVLANADFKTHLIELVDANRQGKDGDAHCQAFKDMIARAEKVHKCIVVAFGCDNDGGSQKGRKLLVADCPWLFGPACWAHQFNLMVADYFKAHPTAMSTAESATDFIGWLLNHTKVRIIFEDVQREQQGKVLSYLVANLTRWTTHYLAFNRLLRLEEPTRTAVISHERKIIAAQVGAAQHGQADRLRTAAQSFCNLADDKNFWRNLKAVVDDIKPICLATNIGQADDARPDQILLAVAGVFRHFSNYPDATVRNAMIKKLEERWKAAGRDQCLFVFAIILNPFERLTRFGDKANVNPLAVTQAFDEMYSRVRSRPPPNDLTQDQLLKHEELKRSNRQKALTAFAQYLALNGPFRLWENHKETHISAHGEDPLAFWRLFEMSPETAELADFAKLVLSVVVNQGGTERRFSDCGIKKTKRRNKMKIGTLEKSVKVSDLIRAEHAQENLTKKRKRANHTEEEAGKLLAVPKYVEEMLDVDDDDDDDEDRPSILVSSGAGWRRTILKWLEDGQELEDLEEDSNSDPELPAASHQEKWLPITLESLFGGNPIAERSLDTAQEGFQADIDEEMVSQS